MIKKLLISAVVLIAGISLGAASSAYALATYQTVQGGTGNAGTLSGLVKANGTSPYTAAVSNIDYQAPLSLTTVGSSGAATFNGTILNIPQYTGGGGSTPTFGTSSLSALYPIVYTQSSSLAQLSWAGLGTTTNLTQGQLPYVTGVNTFGQVPTTSVSCSGSLSCTSFTAIGASPITISATGGGSSFGQTFEIDGSGYLTPTTTIAVNVNSGGTTWGYGIDDNLILYASSTNESTLVGQNAGPKLLSQSMWNTAVGFDAMQNATTTRSDVAVGYQALMGGAAETGNCAGFTAIGAQALMTFGCNQGPTTNSDTAVGSSSLRLLTTGIEDTALGSLSAQNMTTGGSNTIIGYNSGRTLSTGSRTTVVGSAADGSNGSDVTVVGEDALDLNAGGATGDSVFGSTALAVDNGGINDAFGFDALSKVVGSSFNNAFGNQSLASTTGQGNTAFGYHTAQNLINVTSSSSTFIGSMAASANTGGWGASDLTIVGAGAGFNLASSSNNSVFLGEQSGFNDSSGSESTFLGTLSGQNDTTGDNNISIGFNALVPNPTASNQLNIGDIIFGTGLTATSSATTLPSTFTGFIGIGSSTPSATLDVAGNINTGVNFGYQIGDQMFAIGSSTNSSTLVGLGAGSALLASTTSAGNSAFGFDALLNATSSSYNTAMGYEALQGSATISGAGFNTAVGYQALTSNSSGTFNTALGDLAGLSNISGVANTFVGASAGKLNISGTNDTFIGSSAGLDNTTGFSNTCVGVNACAQDAQGADNTVLGTNMGFNLSTGGVFNILIGVGGNNNNVYPTTAKDDIQIGDQLQTLPTTGYAQLNIGNLLFGQGLASTTVIGGGQIGVGTTSPFARFSIQANNGDTNNVLFAIGSSTQTATTTLFTVTNAGNVGIGTAAPISPLQIISSASGSSVSALTLTNSFASAGTATSLDFNPTTSATTLARIAGIRTNVTGDTDLAFSTDLIASGLNEKMRITAAGNVGIGSTSPFANLSIQANNGSTNTTLFAIGSSTASATTTLFSVSKIGSTTIGLFGACSGTNALTTNAAGTISCGTISGGFVYPFVSSTFGAINTSATSTAINDLAGLMASSTSYFGSITSSYPNNALSITGDALENGGLFFTSTTTTASPYEEYVDGNGFLSVQDPVLGGNGTNKSIFQIISPKGALANEATLTPIINFGGGNQEGMDIGTQHYGSVADTAYITMWTTGTGILKPLCDGNWPGLSGTSQANTQYIWCSYPTDTFSVGVGTTSNDVNALVQIASSTIARQFEVDTTPGTHIFSVQSTGASSTQLTDSGLTSGNCVQASTGGLLTTTAGACGSGGGSVGNWFTPVPLFGATAANSTSTLTGFTNGIYALASSTIGGGTQTSGLTISGNATTSQFLSVSTNTDQSAVPELNFGTNANNTNFAIGVSGARGMIGMDNTNGGGMEISTGANKNFSVAVNGTAGTFPSALSAVNLLVCGNSSNCTVGNVGIGSTTPGTLLSIGGSTLTTQVANFANLNSTIYSPLTVATTSPAAFVVLDGYGTQDAIFNTASTTGPIFAVEATTTGNPIIFSEDQYGHLLASSTGATPQISCTPTNNGSISATSNDATGDFTTGTLSTACTVTYAHAYSVTPEVVFGGGLTSGLTRSTTSFTATFSAAVTGDDVSYVVIQP